MKTYQKRRVLFFRFFYIYANKTAKSFGTFAKRGTVPSLRQRLMLMELKRYPMDSKRRLAICKKCPFARRWAGAIWCGTPILGHAQEVEGRVVSFCGCAMKVKTKLADAVCPLRKW